MLVVMAAHADAAGETYVGPRTLAHYVGCSPDTIARRQKALDDAGVTTIIIDSGLGEHGKYQGGRRARTRRLNLGCVARHSAPPESPNKGDVGPPLCSVQEAAAPHLDAVQRSTARSPTPIAPHTQNVAPHEGRVAPQATASVGVFAPHNSAGRTKNYERNGTATAAQHASLTWNPTDGWGGLTDGHRTRWAAAFPACDLDRELAKADSWLRANRDKRKQNHERFMHNWLSRAQEQGGTAGRKASGPAAAAGDGEAKRMPRGRYGVPA